MPLYLLPLFLAIEISPIGSGVLYQQPQIASDGRNVGIVFGAKNTIYYAHNDASPVVVAEAPVLSLGNHRGPRLAFTAWALVMPPRLGLPPRRNWPVTLGCRL